MTDRKLAKKQFVRFDSLSFPPTIEGKQELFNTLVNLADDEEHAKRIVDELLEEPLGNDRQQRWPTGYDIRQAAMRTKGKRMEPDRDCAECGGMGFRSERRVIGGTPYDFSTGRCSCWRSVEVEVSVG